ncbi:MAG: rod shape-determining protein MreD [Clostridiaceae bacterium]
MKRIILILIGLLFFTLDNAVLPVFHISGSWGSLLFTFAICYSILGGAWEAVFIGAYSGILQDVFFANAFGVNSLINLILCLLASAVGKNIFRNRRTIPVITVFLATFMKYMLVYVILLILKADMYLSGIMLVSLINAVFAFIFYKKIYKFTEKSYMKDPWKFN